MMELTMKSSNSKLKSSKKSIREHNLSKTLNLECWRLIELKWIRINYLRKWSLDLNRSSLKLKKVILGLTMKET
jgi:hypothetical protein